MTLAAFLTLRGDGEQVQGSAIQKTREKKIYVCGWRHRVDAERVPAPALGSGLTAAAVAALASEIGKPTDKRKHGVLTVQKTLDRATPSLRKHQAKGTKFSTFELQCWRIPPAGGGPNGVNEENHVTITLEGAKITAIRFVMANARWPQNSALPEWEEVDFSYKSIKFTWHALTGEGAQVFGESSPDLVADWTNRSVDTVAREMMTAMASKLGEEIGGALNKLLLEKGKQLLTPEAK